MFLRVEPTNGRMRDHYAVLNPRSPGTFTLDVTTLTPEQSVEAIVAHIKSLGR